jgi:uncharacterized protein
MINKQDISDMVTELVASFQPQRVILFGSYAEDGATEQSDVDILVIKPVTDKNRYEMIRTIRQQLRNFRFPKDILVCSEEEYEREKDDFSSVIYPISQRGKVLYEAKS